MNQNYLLSRHQELAYLSYIGRYNFFFKLTPFSLSFLNSNNLLIWWIMLSSVIQQIPPQK